ncbi:hypothetical protein HK096_001105, partial [Nowakowskiella sp. JEL0078]
TVFEARFPNLSWLPRHVFKNSPERSLPGLHYYMIQKFDAYGNIILEDNSGGFIRSGFYISN